jgi:uncharacterized coiled-coil DUF342 family protein
MKKEEVDSVGMLKQENAQLATQIARQTFQINSLMGEKKKLKRIIEQKQELATRLLVQRNSIKITLKKFEETLRRSVENIGGRFSQNAPLDQLVQCLEEMAINGDKRYELFLKNREGYDQKFVEFQNIRDSLQRELMDLRKRLADAEKEIQQNRGKVDSSNWGKKGKISTKYISSDSEVSETEKKNIYEATYGFNYGKSPIYPVKVKTVEEIAEQKKVFEALTKAGLDAPIKFNEEDEIF